MWNQVRWDPGKWCIMWKDATRVTQLIPGTTSVVGGSHEPTCHATLPVVDDARVIPGKTLEVGGSHEPACHPTLPVSFYVDQSMPGLNYVADGKRAWMPVPVLEQCCYCMTTNIANKQYAPTRLVAPDLTPRISLARAMLDWGDKFCIHGQRELMSNGGTGEHVR